MPCLCQKIVTGFSQQPNSRCGLRRKSEGDRTTNLLVTTCSNNIAEALKLALTVQISLMILKQ